MSMVKNLALTDIHMKAAGRTIIGLDPYENFKRGFNHVVPRHPDAKRVILMGDLTNSGTMNDYTRVAEISGLPNPDYTHVREPRSKKQPHRSLS